MSKKLKRSLFAISALSTLGLITSCSCSKPEEKVVEDRKKTSKEYQEIEKFFEYNEPIFNNIKETVLSEYFDNEFDSKVFNQNLMEFLNNYKKIYELETKKISIKNIETPFNKEEISNKLKEYDKIVNSNNLDFNSINASLVSSIQKTYNELLKANEFLKNIESSFVDFVQNINNLGISSVLFKEYILNNFSNINNQKEKTTQEIIAIDNKLKSIAGILAEFNNSEVFVTEISKFKDLKEELKTTSDLESLLNKLSALTTAISDKIEANNLVSTSVKVQKSALENSINSNDNLSEEEKQTLLNKLNEAKTNYQLNEIEKELKNASNNIKNKVIALKDDSKYNPIFGENLNNFKSYLFTLSSKTELDQYRSELDALEEKFNALNEKYSQLKAKVNSSQVKAQTQFEFYKAKIEYDKLFKNGALATIDLSNLTQKTNELNALLTKLSELESNDQNIQANNDTLQSLFDAEATKNLTYSLKNNLQHFELDNYLYSASINKSNSKMYLNDGDTDLIDYEVKDIKLKDSDKNILSLTIEATLKTNPQIKKTLTKEINGFKAENNLNTVIDSLTIANLDEIFEVNYDELNVLTTDEVTQLNTDQINAIFNSKLNGIGKFFGYKIKDSLKVEGEKVKTTIQITFGDQIVKELEVSTAQNITFRSASKPKQEAIDERDLNKILSIINGGPELFLSQLKFKEGATKNHSYYLAGNAIEAFNNEYVLPRFGKYEIYIRGIHHHSNKDGYAWLTLWYKENGNIAPLPGPNYLYKKHKLVFHFRKQNFEDITPLNSKFYTAQDFEKIDNAVVPEADITMFNSITEANINHRLANGKTYNAEKAIKYRSLNLDDFFEQEAFNKFPYFFSLEAAKNRRGENLDNSEFLPFNAGLYTNNIEIVNDAQVIKKIIDNYYVYGFDFQRVGKRGLSFKLGFINKDNNKIRYKLDKTFTLINIINDYEQNLYPEIILNNINLSDLSINKSLLASKSAKEFSNDLDALNQVITINSDNGYLKHNNFKLSKSDFKIVEVKRINNDSAYIRFGTFKYVHDLKNNEVVHTKVEIKSKTWFKISGFAPASSEDNSPNQDLDFEGSNLETIVQDSNNIYRKRVLEPYWSDLTWKINYEQNVATWLLNKKYLEKTLLSNSRNRKVNLHIYGYRFVNDFRKNDRINSDTDGINFQIDFDKLLNEGTLVQDYLIPATVVKNQNVPAIKVRAIFTWDENQGIQVSLVLVSKTQKIVLAQPDSVKFNEPNAVFEEDKSFVMLPGGVKVSVEYTNNIEQEDFGLKTNRFDYNDVDYNQLNQPILFSNNIDDLMNKEVYNPNQNVSFKLNDGFKMNLDHIRFKQHRTNNYINSVWNRTMRYTQGTATMIGKVSSDPKDGRFYILTNHHVQGQDDRINNWEDYSGVNFLKEYVNTPDRNLKLYLTVPFEHVRNNIISGPGTDGNGWGVSYVSDNVKDPGFKVSTRVIWTARKQLDKYTGTKTIDADLTVVIWDVNPIIKALRERGMMHVAKHLLNWFNLPELEFNWKASQYSYIPGPHIKDIVHIGYPLGDQTGYINHRAKSNEKTTIISVQNDYLFVRITGGNSGSGFFIGPDQYASTLYGGHLGSELYGRNYDTEEYNYFGINWDNEDPLTLKNNRSLGSMMIRANAHDPNAFALPWFMKETKNK